MYRVHTRPTKPFLSFSARSATVENSRTTCSVVCQSSPRKGTRAPAKAHNGDLRGRTSREGIKHQAGQGNP